eukprot:m.425846 g.425846  ORF g.425846 m.425846 type:complete len:303 (+) comp21349_c0_seq1:1865-2773(+)
MHAKTNVWHHMQLHVPLPSIRALLSRRVHRSVGPVSQSTAGEHASRQRGLCTRVGHAYTVSWQGFQALYHRPGDLFPMYRTTYTHTTNTHNRRVSVSDAVYSITTVRDNHADNHDYDVSHSMCRVMYLGRGSPRGIPAKSCGHGAVPKRHVACEAFTDPAVCVPHSWAPGIEIFSPHRVHGRISPRMIDLDMDASGGINQGPVDIPISECISRWLQIGIGIAIGLAGKNQIRIAIICEIKECIQCLKLTHAHWWRDRSTASTFRDTVIRIGGFKVQRERYCAGNTHTFVVPCRINNVTIPMI